MPFKLSFASVGCGSRRVIVVTTSCAAILLGGLTSAAPAGASAVPAWSVTPTPYPSAPVAVQLVAVSCTSSTTCMAVGNYYNINGVQATLTEAWNGHTWNVAPSPNPLHSGESVLNGVSCTSPTACVAAGYYQQASGDRDQLTLVETWNGSTWKIEPSPTPSGTPEAQLSMVSCSSPSACAAAGWQQSGNYDVPLAETWNGNRWAIDPAPMATGSDYGELSGVSCTSPTACVAVGRQVLGGRQSTLADSWNGTAWVLETTPSAGGAAGAQGSGLSAVSCIRESTRCTATGYSIATDGDNQTLAEVRNGTSWKIQGTPTPTGSQGIVEGQLNGVSCASLTACTAAGDHIDDAGNDAPLAETWNGRAWKIQSTPDPTNPAALLGISCPSARRCTAVGANYGTMLLASNANGNGVTVLESWNGSAWSVQPSPNPVGLLNNSLSAVSCVSPVSCVSVGDYDRADGSPVPISEIWNGVKWRLQMMPAPASAEVPTLTAVSCVSSTYCMAVGKYTPVDSLDQLTLSEIWNGAKWRLQSMPSPSGAGFSTLTGVTCTSPTFCMAAGSDDVGEGSTLVESWNGRSWEVPPSPDATAIGSNTLTAISCASGASCDAVGEYALPDEPYQTLAEAWDGTAWTLQSSPDAPGTTDNYLTGVSCASAGVCTASGYANVPSGTETLAELLNSGKWTISATPNPGNGGHLFAVSCSSAAACSAVGDYETTNSNFDVTLAEQWNGSSWVVQPTHTKGVGVYQETELKGVSCTSPVFCMAIGWNLRAYVTQYDSIRAVAERYS